MNYCEVKGNLFEKAPRGYYLAHCISGDYTLGAGIAKTFNALYDMRKKLHKHYPIPSGEEYANVGSALLIDEVFNLVSKPKYYYKPYLSDLGNALEDMKNFCVATDITRIAMPKIGAGLDKLDWESVKNLILNIFKDTEIDIAVYYL